MSWFQFWLQILWLESQVIEDFNKHAQENLTANEVILILFSP